MYEQIYESFLKMEAVGTVDFSVVKKLEALATSIQKEKKSLFKKKMAPHRAFSVYHCLETQLRVLSTMVQRLRDSQANSDNPKIATDSLGVLPSLINLNKNLYRLPPRQALNLATSIQNNAINLSLYPSKAEVISHIDRETTNKEFEKFSVQVIETLNEA